MRIGLIARMDKSGLGVQTAQIAEMLQPSKIMIIDSTSFRGSKQHPEWYNSFENKFIVKGFPQTKDFNKLLEDVDIVITCEIPYGYELFDLARKKGVKTILQPNWEFFDYLRNQNLPQPDELWLPSEWHQDEYKHFLRNVKVKFLPPPTYYNIPTRIINIGRWHNYEEVPEQKLKILHIVGNKAIHDRNGTDSVIEAAQYTKSNNFELTIKSQNKDIKIVNDPRIKYDFDSPDSPFDLYEGFDLMIMPRRYGGLCLPVNEALAHGIPVIMTDISPNDMWLPDEWLVKSYKIGEFMTRSMIDIYEVDLYSLVDKIDEFCNIDDKQLMSHKEKAIEIYKQRFDPFYLKTRWEDALNE